MGQIRTTRKYNKFPSFDLLYEWEDQIKNELNLSFFYSHDVLIKNRHILSKISELLKINLTDRNIGKSEHVFCFDMNALPHYRPINSGGVSVCIVDFYIPKDQISRFADVYKANRKVFVSSMQAACAIRKNAPGFSFEHLPLTLPDKYKIRGGILNKYYDVAILGHTSPILLSWLNDYRRSHDIDCLVRTTDNKGQFLAKSSRTGKMEMLQTREDYFRVLRKTKVVFYNTSGIDDSRLNTYGYHQVTPRFLEYLSCGCHLISRYEINEDVEYYEVPKFTKHINNYKEFERELDRALQEEPDMDQYSSYLEKHYTSTIMPKLREVFGNEK